MSDFDELKYSTPDEDPLDGLSLDDLLQSARDELARADALIEGSAPQPERSQTSAPQPAPQLPRRETAAPPQRSVERHPQPETAEEEAAPRHAKLSPGLKVLLYVCVVLFVSVGLAVGGWRCAQDVLALSKPDRLVTVTVDENMSISALADCLHEQELIDYPWLFKFYCWYSHAEDKIDPGTYQLNNLYDYHALVSGMIASSGDRAEVTITVPEGYECADIFALLAENGVSTVDALETAAATCTFDYSFLAELPYGDKNRLEGYLFPDTYNFYLDDTPENVLDKFLRNFERKLTDELLAQLDVLNSQLALQMEKNDFTPEEIAASELTLYDVITVASLVEKETAKTSESATIASVIYNRLCSKLYPCLQIDATIQYALTERKEVLSNADKAVISPYNTYTNAGLPAGPIANPGINSIRAALYPAETDYYFYALGADGVHKFSQTYYEHQDFLDSLNGSEQTADAEPQDAQDAVEGSAPQPTPETEGAADGT